MTVIGAPLLREMVNKYSCIYPSEESAFDGDGYVLTVREDRTLNYLEHRNMISREIVFTPPDVVAHLTSKSKFGRLGLSFLRPQTSIPITSPFLSSSTTTSSSTSLTLFRWAVLEVEV